MLFYLPYVFIALFLFFAEISEELKKASTISMVLVDSLTTAKTEDEPGSRSGILEHTTITAR